MMTSRHRNNSGRLPVPEASALPGEAMQGMLEAASAGEIPACCALRGGRVGQVARQRKLRLLGRNRSPAHIATGLGYWDFGSIQRVRRFRR